MTAEQVVDRLLLDHVEEHAAQISATQAALSASPRP
jgi:hypothetical protein